jgi:hypothetical protein
MDCSICTTGGNNIPTEELKEHLTTKQHPMDENVATLIDYLFKRLEKLEAEVEGKPKPKYVA